MIGQDRLSWRFIKIWQRNLLTYQKIWKVNFLTPLIEPLLYILAFGLGLSGMIGEVSYGGQLYSYTAFIAPALIATAVMHNAFFETTYASFVRMYYQKTFDGMLASPLSLEEIILAEIVWSATKAAAAATLMLLVLTISGYVAMPSGLMIIPLAFIGGLAFGAVGLFFTGLLPTIEGFLVIHTHKGSIRGFEKSIVHYRSGHQGRGDKCRVAVLLAAIAYLADHTAQTQPESEDVEQRFNQGR